MVQSKNLSSFVIGLALFAMFFGSGNLIFPLFVGQVSTGDWIISSFGFFATAVLIPFLGVIAMVAYRGDYIKFFENLGKPWGFLFTFFLLFVWIPLGSGPRCISLGYSSITTFIENFPPLWAFSLLWCIAVYFIICKKSRMINILGYYLTPLLLACLAIIFIKGIDFSRLTPTSSNQSLSMLTFGMKEGYNTMDLIAAFFFSASIIGIIRKKAATEKKALSKALKSGLIGMAILGAVYLFLIALGASHAEALVSVPKDKLLVTIAKNVLGPTLGIISAIAVCLACLTTSVALVAVFAEYLAENIFKDAKKFNLSIFFTLASCFAMSLTGLEGITFVTQPMLQIFYPTLIILMGFIAIRSFIKAKKKEPLGLVNPQVASSKNTTK